MLMMPSVPGSLTWQLLVPRPRPRPPAHPPLGSPLYYRSVPIVFVFFLDLQTEAGLGLGLGQHHIGDT